MPIILDVKKNKIPQPVCLRDIIKKTYLISSASVFSI